MEAIELCALAGLHLDPWEQLALTDMLGEREDGRWAAFEFGLVVPRQNGKGSILEGRELVGLFLLGEMLLIHSAHEQATSSEHFRRLLNLIESVPEFERRVLKAPKGKGAEAIELRGGQRIFFKTRTADGGRGLTGDFVALDEAMKLRSATMAALGPTMAARSMIGNPQMVYAGSAVDQETEEHGVILARVRERALNASPRLGYLEWSCEGDDPSALTDAQLRDPEMWARANPGLGIRISLEHVGSELGMLGARKFAVERLGIGDWPATDDSAERVISQQAWAELADPGSRISGTPTFALDVDPGQAWASISAAGERPDGLWHVGVVEHDRGVGWVVAKCRDWLEHFPSSQLVVDPRADLADLLTELNGAGIQPVRTTANDYKDACGGFFRGVMEKRLRYMPPQPELDVAIAGARSRKLLDAWKWDRSVGALMTPLVSCTLALWGARTQGIPEVHSVREALERLSGNQPAEPEPAPVAPESGQTNFIPLDQMPPQRGLFRP